MKVSIIMTAYNTEKYVKQALKSIPKRDDIEIIFVNDGSTDKTKEIASKFNVLLIDNETNKGISYSRREALKHTNGEYIMFFDSDDTIIEDNFNKLINEIDGSEIIYYDLINNNNELLHLAPETKMVQPGGNKLFKKSYINNFEYPQVSKFDDVRFNEMIQSVPHTEKYTNLIVIKYNYPRDDNTSLKWIRGEL